MSSSTAQLLHNHHLGLPATMFKICDSDMLLSAMLDVCEILGKLISRAWRVRLGNICDNDPR